MDKLNKYQEFCNYLKEEYPYLNIISGKLLSSYLDNEEIQKWLV